MAYSPCTGVAKDLSSESCAGVGLINPESSLPDDNG